jgi:lipoprotein-anchoring transpeptidase ErfK/SrfK
MAFPSLPSSIAFALAATASIAVTTTAQAQGLFDFLWGGTQEWGGGRQMVSFDPKFTPGQIIVSFGDRRLYNIVRSGQAMSYPIAVPREQSRWQGTTTVTDKRVNPSWRPTPEMIRENPKLPNWVPGGHPMNPLGVRAMYLGASTYRIHGTDAPWTIGQAVSKGCIRMLNEDVLDLYPKIPVGTKVTVTWQQFGSHAIASNADADAGAYTAPEPAGDRAPPTSRKIKNLPTMTPPSDDSETIAAVQTDGGSPLPVDESGKPAA